jgi:4-alpha-glucanotransferase
MLVQLEDVAGEEEQANLRGTSDAHPNCRRRRAMRLGDVLARPGLGRIAALVDEERRGAGWYRNSFKSAFARERD